MAYQIIEIILIAVVVFVVLNLVVTPKITRIDLKGEFNNRLLSLDKIRIINLDDSEMEQLVNLADEAKKTNDISAFYDYILKNFRSVRITKSYMICVKKVKKVDKTEVMMKHKNIVALRIVNNEDGSIMDTFYLVNPDADKLEKLKKLVENRFADEMNNDENPFVDDYSIIYDYIAENFQSICTEDFTIEW